MPNGLVPPTRYPVWRVAVSGEQGDMARKLFRGDVEVTMHQDHQRLLRIGLHDDGLDHRMLGHTQFPCRMGSTPMIHIRIQFGLKGNLGLTQGAYSSCDRYIHGKYLTTKNAENTEKNQ
jgi:hypothetical protein